MGKKYTIHTDGNTSEFEDDDGEVHRPDRSLGKGINAEARQFNTTKRTYATITKTRSVVVLAPIAGAIDESEVNTKLNFFRALYPDKTSTLFRIGDTYRLVLPFLPGNKYADLVLTEDPLEQIALFLSAVTALQECHAKKYVVVDFHSSNILYNMSDRQSYLIDGGYYQKLVFQ